MRGNEMMQHEEKLVEVPGINPFKLIGLITFVTVLILSAVIAFTNPILWWSGVFLLLLFLGAISIWRGRQEKALVNPNA